MFERVVTKTLDFVGTDEKLGNVIEVLLALIKFQISFHFEKLKIHAKIRQNLQISEFPPTSPNPKVYVPVIFAFERCFDKDGPYAKVHKNAENGSPFAPQLRHDNNTASNDYPSTLN